MDTSSILGYKPTDPTQNLSGMLNIVNSMQQNQRGDMALQNEAINLNERKAAIPFLQSGSFLNDDGTLDTAKLTTGLTKIAPTTGMKMAQEYAAAHTQATAANTALNALTSDLRGRIGSALSALPANAAPELVGKTLDALGAQYKGAAPLVAAIKQGYTAHAKQDPAAGSAFLRQTARGVLPQENQQTMDTPSGTSVDDGATTYQVNLKPSVPGLPVGGVIPGTSVTKQPPPTQPTIGADNQPGILGPRGVPPVAGSVPGPRPAINAAGHPMAYPDDSDFPQIINGELGKAKARLSSAQTLEDRQRAQSDIDGLRREAAAKKVTLNEGGFVPTGPVPGANESKIGSVQLMNDHWSRLNSGAADSPVAQSLLSSIRSLAPKAIDGTESGKRAYWNGLLNSVGLGDKKTGDLQTDTDMLNKAMAQLNLATPATTDAMRTLVEAGRPHSTMSADAIKQAASQIEGQIKANRAMRDMLQPDKAYASGTGDPSHYEQKRQTLEPLMDPRIFEYEGLPKAERKAFMAKITNSEERAALIDKTRKLEAMGVFK